jgi:hypothetical protein
MSTLRPRGVNSAVSFSPASTSTPFDNVALNRHAGTARFAAQHVRRCEHDVPAVRRKVFFARSRKSTPISNPLEQRRVALEAPLPGFNDQTE